MKTPFIVLYALFVSMIANAQSISIEPVVSASADVLYAGQTNVFVARNLPDGAKISLLPAHYFQRIGSDTIAITPEYCSSPRKEELSLVVSKGLDILKEQVFTIAYDGPLLTIDTMACKDSVSKSYLLQHSFEIVPGSLHYEIKSFTISFIAKRGDVIGPLPSNGRSLSNAQKDLLHRLKNGDAIYVEDIKAECQQCGYPPFFRKYMRVVMKH